MGLWGCRCMCWRWGGGNRMDVGVPDSPLRHTHTHAKTHIHILYTKNTTAREHSPGRTGPRAPGRLWPGQNRGAAARPGGCLHVRYPGIHGGRYLHVCICLFLCVCVCWCGCVGVCVCGYVCLHVWHIPESITVLCVCVKECLCVLAMGVCRERFLSTPYSCLLSCLLHRHRPSHARSPTYVHAHSHTCTHSRRCSPSTPTANPSVRVP